MHDTDTVAFEIKSPFVKDVFHGHKYRSPAELQALLSAVRAHEALLREVHDYLSPSPMPLDKELARRIANALEGKT